MCFVRLKPVILSLFYLFARRQIEKIEHLILFRTYYALIRANSAL